MSVYMGNNNPLVAYYVGLDLGQHNQFTSMAVLEARFEQKEDVYLDPTYTVSYLERFKLGTTYQDQANLLTRRIAALDAAGRATRANEDASVHLAVDITGTGFPVLDVIKRAGLEPLAISMTNGDTVVETERGYGVPKKDLISSIYILMQERRLLVAPGLELGQLLATELDNFRFKASLQSPETASEWREGKQDDLVFAVGVATWLAAYKPFKVEPVGSLVIFGVSRDGYRDNGNIPIEQRTSNYRRSIFG